MVDALLISPPYKGLLREPLGLYYLSSVLNANGISTALMDFNVESLRRSEFHKYVRDLEPRIAGVTSYTFNFSAAQKILEEIRLINPKIFTVMGGVHASAIPEVVLKNTDALDYIVVGEGEFTFLELCRKIFDGDDVRDVEGLAFRDEGEVIVNPLRDLIKNMDELPAPNRELLHAERYPVISVQTSRGCPYNCIFCNINTFYGRKIRFRDPKKVIDECEFAIKKFGAKNFFFFGDSFTFNADWVEEFCNEIDRRGLGFIWGCETRVDNVGPELLDHMRKSGCYEVQYGIDYGDEEILKKLGKDVSLNSVREAVIWAKKAGLFTGGFFIFNVPGENKETIENTFQLIQKVPVDAIEVNLLTPYPGTSLWADPKKWDMRIIEHNFDYYTTKKYVIENINFPRGEFVPAFNDLLRRLNFMPTPNHYPEIYDFLKKNISLNIWKEEGKGISKYLRLKT